jgi:hypothetical protein
MHNSLPWAASWLLLSALNAQLFTARAQGTAFTYQGRFYDMGSRANGSYDLTFAVFSDSNGINQVSGTVTDYAVPINNGLFAVTLDFGPGIFTGPSLWLQIGAETNGAGGAFTTLTPLQQLTPTPYAIYATSAGSATSAAFASAAGAADGVANGSVTGAGIAGGSVVKSLNNLQDAVTLSPGANISITSSGNSLTIAAASTILSSSSNAWSLAGNADTSPTAGNFVGTTDDNPLELHVNSQRALRLEPTATNGSVNVIGGSSANYIPLGTVGATIGGGGATNYSGSYTPNYVASDFGTIGGGVNNTVAGSAFSSTIGGGNINTILSGDTDSTIGGGGANTIGNGAFSSTISGGYVNWIQSEADDSTIGGGEQNTIQTSAGASTIGGGTYNTIWSVWSVIGGGVGCTIQTNAEGSTIGGGIYDTNNGPYGAIGGGYFNEVGGQYATVPGGYQNSANGQSSLAAGQNATASYNNSFVWGDGTRAALDQAADTFNVLATGGAYFYTTTSGVNIDMDSSGDLDFGSSTRQMLNLFSLPGAANNYGLGIQTATLYFRCGNDVSGTGFAWYRGGTPNNNQMNSGGGQTLMTLTTGGLTVNGTFVSASDRNLKEHFQPVDAGKVLDQVAALPITKWNYKEDASTEHIGPMAQDFYAAFKVGPDDKHITTVDESGVALAAIQALNVKLEEQKTENAELKQQLAELSALVQKLARQK